MPETARSVFCILLFLVLLPASALSMVADPVAGGITEARNDGGATATLEIPPGALLKAADITLAFSEKVPENPIHNHPVTVVTISPADLTLIKPAKLSIRPARPGSTDALILFFIAAPDRALPLAARDAKAASFTAEIHRGGTYLVARPSPDTAGAQASALAQQEPSAASPAELLEYLYALALWADIIEPFDAKGADWLRTARAGHMERHADAIAAHDPFSPCLSYLDLLSRYLYFGTEQESKDTALLGSQAAQTLLGRRAEVMEGCMDDPLRGTNWEVKVNVAVRMHDGNKGQDSRLTMRVSVSKDKNAAFHAYPITGDADLAVEWFSRTRRCTSPFSPVENMDKMSIECSDVEGERNWSIPVVGSAAMGSAQFRLVLDDAVNAGPYTYSYTHPCTVEGSPSPGLTHVDIYRPFAGIEEFLASYPPPLSFRNNEVEEATHAKWDELGLEAAKGGSSGRLYFMEGTYTIDDTSHDGLYSLRTRLVENLPEQFPPDLSIHLTATFRCLDCRQR